MADYTPCRRGEKFFAPTIWYPMQQITPYILKTQIDGFVAKTPVLVSDLETAKKYGIIKDKLRKKGRPLPENDIWIAALALQYDLVLLTRDAHFQQIEMIKISTV
jgi:predicted nucleic acid-binding protein